MRLRRVVTVAALLVVLLPVLGLVVLSLLPDRLLARGGYEVGATRLVTGLFVGGTASQPVLYVSSSDPRIGAGVSGEDLNLDRCRRSNRRDCRRPSRAAGKRQQRGCTSNEAEHQRAGSFASGCGAA